MSFASASTTIKLHEFPSGDVIHNYQPSPQSDGLIRSISWSKDGNWLALVPDSGPAEIIGLKDQLKRIHTIDGIEEPSCASFQNTTKKNIAIGTRSGQVLVYDIKARSVKKRYPRTTGAVSRVEFTAKDSHIVAACDNGEAYIYSNVHNTLAGSFKIPKSQSISVVRTGPVRKNYVVAGSNEGVVGVWDICRNKNTFVVEAHKAQVTAVVFSPVSSDLIVSAGLDRQFCFYDIRDNKCIGNIFVENSMTAVDFSPDGKFILLGSQKGKIYIYDSKNIKQPYHSFVGHNTSIEHLFFRKREGYESSFVSAEECVASNASAEARRSDEFVAPDTINNDETTEDVGSCKSGEDSFLAAVGIGLTPESNCKPATNCKQLSGSKFTPTLPSRLLKDGALNNLDSVITSTPDFLEHGTSLPRTSPIQYFSGTPIPNQTETILASIEDLVRSAVKQELNEMLQTVNQEMKYGLWEILDETRQMSLDLTMMMVKESVKMENNFYVLREEMVAGVVPKDRESLLEEIKFLRETIVSLEKENTLLKDKQVSQNVD